MSFNKFPFLVILLLQTKTLFGLPPASSPWTLHHDSSIVNIISAVKESTVTSYIEGLQSFGTRYWNNPNRDSVFSWVKEHFLQTGVNDVRFDSFQYLGTLQNNIIATIPGTIHPEMELIVGGHIDSYSTNVLQAPGADDNASGTAAALEMARVLVSHNYQPTVTIRFIGFAAEEAGLRGSADYAAKARSQNSQIKMMFNFDMIGYRNQSSVDREYYLVWYPGSEQFSNLLAEVSKNYTTLMPILTTNYRSSSDSWSFYQQGYNTLFAIERDFNPYYHSPSDSLSKLDIPYACEIIKSGLASLLILDQIPSTPTELRAQGITNGIILSWKKNSSLDIQGYNIYRRGSSEENFVQLNLQPCVDTIWIDTVVTQEEYWYRVSAIDLISLESPLSDSVYASPLTTADATAFHPTDFKLQQNYPNPFNSTTTVSFVIHHSSFVSLKMYDGVGNEVATLVNEKRAPGSHEVVWNAGAMASGAYFYQLRTPEFIATKKLLLIR